jgi:signal transduction histidine kinase
MDAVSPQNPLKPQHLEHLEHPQDPELDPLPIPQTKLANAIAIVSLGLLTWTTLSEIRKYEHGIDTTVAVILLSVTGLAWLTWVLVRGRAGWATAPVLITLALAGGALAAFAPIAIIFTAVATLGAAMAWRLRGAAVVGAGGWIAMLIAVLATDHAIAIALGGLAAILTGALIGFTRREVVERTHQAAQVEVAETRAELESTRAELLGERNHLAREIHDVLAHTLAALSLQLEAFATVVDAEPETSPAVRAQLDKTKQLVREGLNEARGAVQALRDDAAPLDDQLRRLSARHHADFTLSGPLQPLSAGVVMSLYRVAQEALTNVMKHAPGAPTAVRLTYEPDCVALTVDNAALGGAGSNGTTNGAARSNGVGFLASSGGGYGLRGIAERVALLGGRVEAGPTAEGWRVEAVVPLEPVAEGRTVPA